MPDYFDPEKLVIRKAQSADRAAAELAQQRIERAAKRLGRRHLSKSPHETTEALSGRAQRKVAREYAESWWQNVRTWRTKTYSDLVFPDGGSHTSGAYFEPITMGQSSSGNMSGDVLYTHVLTPMGWVSESALGRVLGEYPELARLRAGSGKSTLLHDNGRGWNGKEALYYGTLILRVADSLGDEQAGKHLTCLQFVGV